jgi:adenosine deaminase
MYEDHPYDLLKEMATLHVMVEINLTSNDVILGITGKDHPFPIYRKFSVPVALSTDDEGVSRIDLTHEYVRAVETYCLRYADLKPLALALFISIPDRPYQPSLSVLPLRKDCESPLHLFAQMIHSVN